jgi:hypothetical protein
VTAVQDWLKIVPATPQTMLTFACGLLGMRDAYDEGAPQEVPDQTRFDPPRIARGLERC